MNKFLNKLDFHFETNQTELKLIVQMDTYKGKWNSLEKTKKNIQLFVIKSITKNIRYS